MGEGRRTVREGRVETGRPRGRAGRALATALAVVVAVTATACGSSNGTGGDRKTVLVTFSVLADIARVVAGDHLDVASIVKPGAEVHEYEPTPHDLTAAAKADLVVDNGLGLETWFGRFVSDVRAPHVEASAGIAPIDIAGTDAPNPHAWMSPLVVGHYADTLARAFGDLDPAHAADYTANAARYQGELRIVHDELVAALADLPPERRALVSCEGAFSYLARDARLAEQYIWPVNSEQQATPRQIEQTVGYVREHRVPAVFCESTVSDRPMQQVVDATGARFGGVLYVDSLSEPGGPVPTYLELIRHDVRTIAAGLTGAAR